LLRKLIFWEIARRNQNFSEIFLAKIEIFGPGSYGPQISNQIDAAAAERDLKSPQTRHANYNT